jgi:hypothetical protein
LRKKIRKRKKHIAIEVITEVRNQLVEVDTQIFESDRWNVKKCTMQNNLQYKNTEKS